MLLSVIISIFPIKQTVTATLNYSCRKI